MDKRVSVYLKQLREKYQLTEDIERSVIQLKDQARDLDELTPEKERLIDLAAEELKKKLDDEVEVLRRYSMLGESRGGPWYPGPDEERGNWPKLKKYLLEDKGWDEEAVRSIDEASTDVVSMLANPHLPDADARGLVLGFVQSGKTANMTAVMAKAADAGYKLFIVLAGLTNTLRLQGQRRFNSDLCERMPNNWRLLTSDDIGGDFQMPPDGKLIRLAQGMSQLAVVKKNVAPLEKMIATLGQTPASLLKQLPTLVIDDECDQASVNASGTQYDMTRINQLIRDLLTRLPSKTYIGYTATPFANVLIDPSLPGNEVPEDLYPRDFITALPKPANYFGTEELFGRDAVTEDGDSIDGLDMVREIGDDDPPLLQPPSMKGRFAFEPEMAPSLEDAILYYLLATTVRDLRGQADDHCCMLVHTSVYTDMHFKLAKLIDEHLKDVARQLENKEASLMRKLELLVDDESRRVPARQFGLATPSFGEVRDRIASVASTIRTQVENADSAERLDFSGERRRSIVVGGSVLSRGLTIEGLTVSYFLRSSSQYDTLLQMGRWFGYRFGYQDLPRIWMTSMMARAFRDLAMVEAEIRDDMQIYARHGVTPREFAVRIRKLPGLQITSKGKMLAAQECDVSYSGEHVQTRRFKHRDAQWLSRNWNAGIKLVDRVSVEAECSNNPGKGRIYRGVPVSIIREFLSEYAIHEQHHDMSSARIVEYVDKVNKDGDALGLWNVVIAEPASGTPSEEALGAAGSVRTHRRARLAEKAGDADIKALMSVGDILIDAPGGAVSGQSWEEAKRERAKIAGKRPVLILYVISKVSEPKSATSKERVALDAIRDVLAVGIVFPDLGERSSYVRVRLPVEAGGEDLTEAITGGN